MNEPSRRLSILLLTEDSGKHGFDTIKALLEKMLFLVDPAHDPSRVRYDPATTEARAGMHFNAWKSRKPRDQRKRVDLIKALATAVSRDDFFVIVHLDGDGTYSQSNCGAICANYDEFRELVMPGVRHYLTQQSERLQRLLVIVPFYSIEAWLYQNFGEIHRIFEEDPGSHDAKDRTLFSDWQHNRALLDEVHSPKDAFGLADKYNMRLAMNQFPAQQVFNVGKSYTNAVMTLRGCQDLVQVLAVIRRW